MVDIADDNMATLHVDGNSTAVSNGDGGVVGQSDVLVVDTVVLDESLIVRPKVVGGPAVKDGNKSGTGSYGC